MIITVENSGSEVSLQDTAKTSGEDNEPHIGLNNVSERLKALCGGTLSINPRDGGGVIITMRIPLTPPA